MSVARFVDARSEEEIIIKEMEYNELPNLDDALVLYIRRTEGGFNQHQKIFEGKIVRRGHKVTFGGDLIATFHVEECKVS